MSKSKSRAVVAVTGASGYIGSYIVAELLQRGYGVRGLVRGVTKNPAKAQHLRELPRADQNLVLFDGGDLGVKGSFDEAFNGADAVVHTAAAVVLGRDQSIIEASVEGTRNVLKSVDASPTIKRFVHTSSIAAIQTYDKPRSYVFSEADWNDWSTIKRGDAYGVAKTEAERIVHRHFENDVNGRTAVALNPGVVIGPVMAKAHTKASSIFLRDLIYNNKVLTFPSTYVDIRDVATAHVNALEQLPGLHGRRFVLTADSPCMIDGALELGAIAQRMLPNYEFDPRPQYSPATMSLVRTASRLPFIGSQIMTEVERVASCTPIQWNNSASRRELGIHYRPLEETVKEGMESIVGLGYASFKPRAKL